MLIILKHAINFKRVGLNFQQNKEDITSPYDLHIDT